MKCSQLTNFSKSSTHLSKNLCSRIFSMVVDLSKGYFHGSIFLPIPTHECHLEFRSQEHTHLGSTLQSKDPTNIDLNLLMV